MSGLEVKKPIRFIFFFGLFLSFVILGVRACNMRQSLEEVADIKKVLSDNRQELILNQDPLEKKPSKPKPSKERFSKNNKKFSKGGGLSDTNLNELEAFKTSGSKTTAKNKRDKKNQKKLKSAKKALKVSRKKLISKKKVGLSNLGESRPKKKGSSALNKSSQRGLSKPLVAPLISNKPKMKILVIGKARGYALDSLSQAKLKGAIKLNPRLKKVKVILFSIDPQRPSLVVKKAELKSALLRAGLNKTVNVDFERAKRRGYAEIQFY